MLRQEALSRDHAIPVLPQGIERAVIALIADDHAGRERKEVCPVSPLFALLVERVAAAAGYKRE